MLSTLVGDLKLAILTAELATCILPKHHYPSNLSTIFIHIGNYYTISKRLANRYRYKSTVLAGYLYLVIVFCRDE